MTNSTNQPYLVSFTAGGLLFDETISLLSYLTDDRINSISEQIKTNTLLQTNSQSARQRIVQEIKKRYKASNGDLFIHFKNLSQNEQKIIIFYTCVKTYSILSDFLLDVVVDKWLSRDVEINTSTILYFLDRQSSSHPEIDKWADSTIEKIATVIVRMLNEVGLLKGGSLAQLEAHDGFWKIFVQQRDPWFLQVCLLNKERRERIIHG